jgi:hypothetical protein
MNTNTDKLRENFEAWAWPPHIGYKPRTEPSGQYVTKEDQDMWDAYQAAHNAQAERIAKLEEDIEDYQSRLMNYSISDDYQ